MATRICHSTGTISDLHMTLKRHVSQNSQTMSRAFNISWRISSTPAGLLLRNFLTTSETFARYMGEATTESSNSASSKENMLVWFRSSSKCSFYHSTISPVRVSISPNITYSVLVNMSLGPGHLILHHQLQGCRQCVTHYIMQT